MLKSEKRNAQRLLFWVGGSRPRHIFHSRVLDQITPSILAKLGVFVLSLSFPILVVSELLATTTCYYLLLLVLLLLILALTMSGAKWRRSGR